MSDCVLRAVSNGLHLPTLSELGHDVDDEIFGLAVDAVMHEILWCSKCVRMWYRKEESLGSRLLTILDNATAWISIPLSLSISRILLQANRPWKRWRILAKYNYISKIDHSWVYQKEIIIGEPSSNQKKKPLHGLQTILRWEILFLVI